MQAVSEVADSTTESNECPTRAEGEVRAGINADALATAGTSGKRVLDAATSKIAAGQERANSALALGEEEKNVSYPLMMMMMMMIVLETAEMNFPGRKIFWRWCMEISARGSADKETKREDHLKHHKSRS
jgi:hypothetical protein